MIWFYDQTNQSLNNRWIIHNSQLIDFLGSILVFLSLQLKSQLSFLLTAIRSDLVSKDISVAKLSPVFTFSILFVSLSTIKSICLSLEVFIMSK